MVTDFDKARKWRRVQLACAVVLVVVVIVGVFRLKAHTYRNRDTEKENYDVIVAFYR